MTDLRSLPFLLLLSALLVGCVGSPVDEQPEAVEQANLTLRAGVNHHNNSRYDQAELHFQSALSMFRAIDHPEGIASSCLNIAKQKLELREIDAASTYLELAAEQISMSDLDTLRENEDTIRSSLLILQERFDEARTLIEGTLLSSKDKIIALIAMQNRIRVAFSAAEDDLDPWISRFGQSIESSGMKASSFEARYLRYLAERTEDPADADELYGRALDIYRKLTHRAGIASTLQEWAVLDINSGRQETARTKFHRALYVRQMMEDRHGAIVTLQSMRQLYSDLGSNLSTNRITTWQSRLEKKDFDRWEDFIEAFDTYPAERD